MAEHSTSGHDSDLDFAAHQATYNGFITATKYATGAIIVLLILMAAFLVR